MRNSFVFSIDKADKIQDKINEYGFAKFSFGVPDNHLHLRSRKNEFCYIEYNPEYFKIDDFWKAINEN